MFINRTLCIIKKKTILVNTVYMQQCKVKQFQHHLAFFPRPLPLALAPLPEDSPASFFDLAVGFFAS